VKPLAADLDIALVRSQEATCDPKKRRLPGPVLTDHGMDLCRTALHAHVSQRLHGAEPF
jgi:hypothetical protein